MTNEHLEHAVNQAIVDHPGLSSQRIGIMAENGIVTLHGEVQSHARKLTAHKLVESIEDVSGVHNHLVVCPSESIDDANIAWQIETLFEADNEIEPRSIITQCHRGKTKLTGYAGNELSKIRAADIAMSVDGVAEVQNLLLINPDRVEKNSNHTQAILDEIRQTVGMKDSGIRVSVVDDTARLAGSVDSIWKKDVAEVIARKHRIKKVGNEIVVN